MAITITDPNEMTSDETKHTAVKVPGGWRLSWLPGRLLGRNQAIVGMMLAEVFAQGSEPSNELVPVVDDGAAELGLLSDEARALILAAE